MPDGSPPPDPYDPQPDYWEPPPLRKPKGKPRKSRKATKSASSRGFGGGSSRPDAGQRQGNAPRTSASKSASGRGFEGGKSQAESTQPPRSMPGDSASSSTSGSSKGGGEGGEAQPTSSPQLEGEGPQEVDKLAQIAAFTWDWRVPMPEMEELLPSEGVYPYLTVMREFQARLEDGEPPTASCRVTQPTVGHNILSFEPS